MLRLVNGGCVLIAPQEYLELMQAGSVMSRARHNELVCFLENTDKVEIEREHLKELKDRINGVKGLVNER